jgi:uncharacterized protein YoaH (UPF0181 family)
LVESAGLMVSGCALAIVAATSRQAKYKANLDINTPFASVVH